MNNRLPGKNLDFKSQLLFSRQFIKILNDQKFENLFIFKFPKFSGNLV